MSPVPLVHSEPPPEFGALEQSERFNDPSQMDRDHSYVPGYGDLRRARDVKLSEYAQGLCRGSDVPSLPVKLRWARTQTVAGDTNSYKVFAAQRAGYRFVKKEDVGSTWFTQMPPDVQEMPDGTLRRGDTVLMVCDAKTAAKNALYQQIRTEQQHTGFSETLKKNLDEAKISLKGIDPIVEKLDPTKEHPMGRGAQDFSAAFPDIPRDRVGAPSDSPTPR